MYEEIKLTERIREPRCLSPWPGVLALQRDHTSLCMAEFAWFPCVTRLEVALNTMLRKKNLCSSQVCSTFFYCFCIVFVFIFFLFLFVLFLFVFVFLFCVCVSWAWASSHQEIIFVVSVETMNRRHSFLPFLFGILQSGGVQAVILADILPALSALVTYR